MLATGKETLVSLGFGAQPFDKKLYPNLKHLYCIAQYPTFKCDVHLPQSFKDSIFSGFSDHSLDIWSSVVALSRGASIIEKHFTLSSGLAVIPGGFDHACSIDFNELKQLVLIAKEIDRVVPFCK
jgi:sialic acid synthase SpsE